MPKQGGPYSRASASTLGTLGPSRQIGLISLESISCIPPFNLEINSALLVGVEEAHSAAIHRLFANQLAGRANHGLCLSGRGASVCGLPLREQAVRQEVWPGASQSQQGPKVGVGGAPKPKTVQITAKENGKGPILGT